MRLLDTAGGQGKLAAIYTEYAETASRWRLPIVLFAPTWRANRDHAKARDNAKALEFVRRFSSCVGALMGPRGDCYSPQAALSREQARAFHVWQAEELSQAGFVLVSTMPAVSEALGMLDVVPAPCLVSFVITADGRLLDGTPLRDAIARIDDAAPRAPLGYWINCVHPGALAMGLAAQGDSPALRRIVGVQGNTSALDPRQFFQVSEFAADSADVFAGAMAQIHRRFSIPVVGGCCGTRREHLEELGRALGATPAREPAARIRARR
jgi:S-methylmethionine-dependent homocysteine/selenocysteine methylase